MAPLRVVIVLVEPPLPFGGAAGRWYYVLLKGLVERGHRVSAFAACGKPGDVEQARSLFPGPDYDLRLYPFPVRSGLSSKWQTLRRPFSYMFGPDLKRDVRAALGGGFDVLHLEQHWAGWLGLGHVDRALLNVHYLLAIDVADEPAGVMGGHALRALALGAERRLVRAYPHLRACSDRLAGALRAIQPGADVSTVPFAIDAALYPFIPDDRRDHARPTVSLIGSMNWQPSLSAAERLLTRLWPEVKRRVPEARVEVVGWEARRALARFVDEPGVTVVENVAETRPYFEAASVLVYAPGRGSGMKIKVQEALAYGVPVVTNAEGAEGLPAVDGVHAGLADDDAGLIDRTVALLRDPTAQDRQRRAARTLVETACGPGPVLDALEAVYERMLPGTAGR